MIDWRCTRLWCGARRRPILQLVHHSASVSVSCRPRLIFIADEPSRQPLRRTTRADRNLRQPVGRSASRSMCGISQISFLIVGRQHVANGGNADYSRSTPRPHASNTTEKYHGSEICTGMGTQICQKWEW